MPVNPNAHILDCTIRDGSYVVDYQFTLEDTAVISRGLAAAGIRHIEVGHGLGLNAQNCGKGNAAITDIEYITAARSAASAEALIGSFFIPGIGTEDSLRSAADAGLNFVRLGIDVDDSAKLTPFVKLAKSLGLEVWGNMMKSYLVSPAEFAEIASRVGDFGVDVVAIVDSAGGMTPDDVAAYAEASVNRTSVPLAFHGHNNLTLAVANCLRFIECGGKYVDGTLAGLGRSGGNAATELLAALLTQRGSLVMSVDWERLVEFADSVMSFCVPFHARTRAVEIATGLNYFHTSFAPVVEEAAAKAAAPLFRTILRLPTNSRKKVTSDMATTAATTAAVENARVLTDFAPTPFGVEAMQRVQPVSLQALAERLRVQKGKTPQQRVISIAHPPGLLNPRIGPLRSTPSTLVAHIEISDASAMTEIANALADSCDLWLIDTHIHQAHMPPLQQPVFVYDDNSVIAQAVADTLQAMSAKTTRIVGADISLQNAINRILRTVSQNSDIDALITCDSATPADESDLNYVNDGGVVLMVRANSLTHSAFLSARKRGLRLWRLDCGTALVAEAERLLNTHNRFVLASGEKEIALGIRVLAGGAVGKAGDIVIDHLSTPRFILGEADGRGGIRPVSAAASVQSKAVQQWIMENWGL
jgi:4-hydroxy 2-oxovalerate aldolase